jgi:hypothetical protein
MEFRKRKTELMENGNFRFLLQRKTDTTNLGLFAANGNENESFFSLVSKE